MFLYCRKGLPMYHVSFVRNPKEALQVPDVQSSSSQQSSAHERLMEPEPSTQSYPQVTSSEHSALKEKLAQLTQSEPGTENEEALLNELMEMVAKDDEESTSYSNLKMPSPPSTRGEVSPSSNVHLTMRQASPDGRNVSLFEPGVSSTPNMDAHDGHIEQYTPGTYFYMPFIYMIMKLPITDTLIDQNTCATFLIIYLIKHTPYQSKAFII